MNSNPANNPALTQDLTEAELDALSNMTVNGSNESENTSFKVQDPAVTAQMRSRRLSAFLDDEPPFRQRAQSVTEAQLSMARRIQDFDRAFGGPAPARRSTN